MQLLKFSAIWCPACLIMNNRYNQIQEKYKLNITEYDYDLNHEEVTKYQIGKTLPVVIIVDEKGQEIKRIVGELSLKKLEQQIEALL